MKALDLRCGVCSAPAGEPCFTPTGRVADKPHAVRVSAAKRGNTPPHTYPPVPLWLEGKL